MDLIQPLRSLLDPIVEHTSFVLDDVRQLVDEHGRTLRLLEYHGFLSDGRLVLLGFYQHAVEQRIVAEMWATDDASQLRPRARDESVARRRRVWSYTPAANAVDLARTIVTEVATWLQCSAPKGNPGFPYD